ncbi:MAG: CDP-diacylglycerol O-phosphatidyltransferase [Deltaproteobacteria bacterium]|nr:CDP-diacylglycerol O-phosphatidyltransferase [Deltaproteobacteria bacterium]
MSSSIVLAWLVHLYTASGAVLAFLAVLLIEQAKFQEAFWLMALAVLIDASDGTLARGLRVKELIPWFDGDRLEDIIDYLNYVLVPALFLIRAELLPPQDAWWLAALPLLASAYGFCQKEAKTADHFFLGFPSYWNIVAFYFYVMQTPRWLNAFAILVLSALVFVPFKYLYPSRSPILRGPTVALGVLWGILVFIMIYRLPESSFVVALVSLLYPAYYLILSLWIAVGKTSPETGRDQ